MDISVRLNKNFMTQYNRLQEEYGEDMAYLNGFGDKQLSYTDFISNFIDSNVVADASIDSSANVTQKNMRILLNEMPKPHRKLLAYNKIYYEIQKKYGFKTANEWLEAVWNGSIYMHDSDSSSFISYCYAYTLERLANEGLFFIKGFNNEPPQHLITFIDFVKEFVSYNSNLSAGEHMRPFISFPFWGRFCG